MVIFRIIEGNGQCARDLPIEQSTAHAFQINTRKDFLRLAYNSSSVIKLEVIYNKCVYKIAKSIDYFTGNDHQFRRILVSRKINLINCYF